MSPKARAAQPDHSGGAAARCGSCSEDGRQARHHAQPPRQERYFAALPLTTAAIAPYPFFWAPPIWTLLLVSGAVAHWRDCLWHGWQRSGALDEAVSPERAGAVPLDPGAADSGRQQQREVCDISGRPDWDDVDEASTQSFPPSDPPAWIWRERDSPLKEQPAR